MTTYYIEPEINKDNIVVGFSKVLESRARTKSLKSGQIEINMNGIKYKDYLNNPEKYYLSGNNLVEVPVEVVS